MGCHLSTYDSAADLLLGLEHSNLLSLEHSNRQAALDKHPRGCETP
jgi:hypothetical protein